MSTDLPDITEGSSDPDRRGFILRMAALAQDEPDSLHEGTDLITRTLQYASSARPRVTREEVIAVIGEEPS